jgi:hypothetical protein
MLSNDSIAGLLRPIEVSRLHFVATRRGLATESGADAESRTAAGVPIIVL